MSEIKVNSVKGVGASTAAITLNNTDGTCTANVTNNLSHRNLLINGAHNVWQRTTSIAGGSALDVFARATDRFWLYSPTSNSGTVQRSTDVPSGFLYSTHNNLNAELTIGTNVELTVAGSDAPFVNGESLTLSFYIKSASARSSVPITFTTRDTSTGTGSVARATTSFDSTTGWTRVIKTVTLSGTVGGSNKMLQFEFNLAIGDRVTGFQLEKGTIATDFEHLPIAYELALCQRYTIAFDLLGSVDNFMVLCQGRWFSGSQAQCYLPFPNEMRELPTIEAVSTSAVGNFFLNNDGGLGGAAMTSLVINERSFKGVTFTCENGASSNAQGLGTTIYSNGNNDAKLVIAAEL